MRKRNEFQEKLSSVRCTYILSKPSIKLCVSPRYRNYGNYVFHVGNIKRATGSYMHIFVCRSTHILLFVERMDVHVAFERGCWLCVFYQNCSIVYFL